VSGVHTETVEAAHAYTRSDVPWEQATRGVMWAHGRTVGQVERARRQGRFAAFAAAFAAVWTVLYLV